GHPDPHPAAPAIPGRQADTPAAPLANPERPVRRGADAAGAGPDRGGAPRVRPGRARRADAGPGCHRPRKRPGGPDAGSGGRWGLTLAWLSRDGKKLLACRLLRTFGYGSLAVVLAIALEQRGLDPFQVGIVLAAALAGSAAITVFWSLVADRYGRRKTVATMAL